MIPKCILSHSNQAINGFIGNSQAFKHIPPTKNRVTNSIVPRCESGGEGVPRIHSLHMHLRWDAPLYFQGQKTWNPPISYTFLVADY